MDVNDNEILEQGRNMKRGEGRIKMVKREEVDANDVDALRLLLDTEQSKELGDLWPDADKRRELMKSLGYEAILDGPPYPSMTVIERQKAIDVYPYTPEVIEDMIKDIDRQALNWTIKAWLTKYLPVVLLLIWCVIYL